MRFDILTIFPQYFQSLELSLLGKAKAQSLLDWDLYDLRDWTEDRHRTVDDTPYGGGAGMVMRPDVWGRAIEHIRATKPAKRPVLAVPSPSGQVLDQNKLVRLAAENDQIIFACGRYEGIDHRLIEHYRKVPDLEVFEFSLGDYVLNGGEVAALAVIEGVGRLVQGVVGNPQSLVEESHGEAGLLEYPAYTRPQEWEGISVPPVLLQGNHRAIERFRRTKSLLKTAKLRPELIWKLSPDQLDSEDRQILAAQGFLLSPQPARLRFRVPSGPFVLSQLASDLFPLACPRGMDENEIAKHISTQLNPQVFAKALADPNQILLVAEVLPGPVAGTRSPQTPSARSGEENWQPVGYTWVEAGGDGFRPDQPDLADKCPPNTAYFSKCYLHPNWHRSGIAAALMETTFKLVLQRFPQIGSMIVGTGQHNRGAKKFYKRHGFKQVGTRVFQVAQVECQDIVAVRDFTEQQIPEWAGDVTQ